MAAQAGHTMRLLSIKVQQQQQRLNRATTAQHWQVARVGGVAPSWSNEKLLRATRLVFRLFPLPLSLYICISLSIPHVASAFLRDDRLLNDRIVVAAAAAAAARLQAN